ncbi:Uncharacterised protein [uncultured archaeon]|nr:Uncharacterised protein [uncultured archaeon]
MTVEEFAAIYSPGGVHQIISEPAQQFAESWTTVVLANYMMDEGTNKFNIGQGLLEKAKAEKPSKRKTMIELGNYLMDEGENKFNLGKKMLKSVEEQNTSKPMVTLQ